MNLDLHTRHIHLTYLHLSKKRWNISLTEAETLLLNRCWEVQQQTRPAIYPTQSFTKVCPTANLRTLLFRSYVRQGWKYFVSFKDVGGFGLQACHRASWQDDSSPVYHLL